MHVVFPRFEKHLLLSSLPLSIPLKIRGSLAPFKISTISPVNFTQSSFCLRRALSLLFLCRPSELHRASVSQLQRIRAAVWTLARARLYTLQTTGRLIFLSLPPLHSTRGLSSVCYHGARLLGPAPHNTLSALSCSVMGCLPPCRCMQLPSASLFPPPETVFYAIHMHSH